MIELPEALNIAKQLNECILGKEIRINDNGLITSKRMTFNPSYENIVTELSGQQFNQVTTHGSCLKLFFEDNKFLTLQKIGGRLFYNSTQFVAPEKYHLQICFSDESCLTIVDPESGIIGITTTLDFFDIPGQSAAAISPITKDFTLDYLKINISDYCNSGGSSIEKFILSGKFLLGIGIGYLNDILFKAYIHPGRSIGSLTGDEIKNFYDAINSVLNSAISQGGRNTEYSIYGKKGRYKLRMAHNRLGDPCSRCGELVEEIEVENKNYFVCPVCQEL